MKHDFYRKMSIIHRMNRLQLCVKEIEHWDYCWKIVNESGNDFNVGYLH